MRYFYEVFVPVHRTRQNATRQS